MTSFISFNPRFAPESEAMLSGSSQCRPSAGFNPRFAPESEAIGVFNAPAPEDGFQSALRSGERSDAVSPPSHFTMSMFQSALRSGERSDKKHGRTKRRASCFNPRFAPESEAMRFR